MEEKIKTALELVEEIENESLQYRLNIVSGLLDRKIWNIAEQILSRTYNEIVIYNSLGKIVSNGGLKTFHIPSIKSK